MRAEIEWVVGVLRGGSEFEKHGDKYEFSCSLIRRGDTVEIIGASGKLTIAAYRAIRDELERQGIKKAIWDRASGKHVEVKGEV